MFYWGVLFGRFVRELCPVFYSRVLSGRWCMFCSVVLFGRWRFRCVLFGCFFGQAPEVFCSGSRFENVRAGPASYVVFGARKLTSKRSGSGNDVR